MSILDEAKKNAEQQGTPKPAQGDSADRKARKAEAAKRVHTKKKEAVKKIVDRLKQLNINDGEINAAIAYLSGTGPRAHGGGFGPPILDVIFGKELKVGMSITGREIYIKTEEASGIGKGMGDMSTLIRKWVQKDIYVSYNQQDKKYTIVGIGTQPANWTGPTKKAE